MTDRVQRPPIEIDIEQSIFDDTVRCFQQDGMVFGEEIHRDPRLAYEVFGQCLRDVTLGRASRIVGAAIKIDRIQDGTRHLIT